MCVYAYVYGRWTTPTPCTHTHTQQKAACVIYLTRGNSILSLCLWVIRVLARPPFLDAQNNIWPHFAIRIISMRHCPWTNTDNALISDARSCVSASYLRTWPTAKLEFCMQVAACGMQITFYTLMAAPWRLPLCPEKLADNQRQTHTSTNTHRYKYTLHNLHSGKNNVD